VAEIVITELKRTGQATEPTPVVFRWTTDTHSSIVGTLQTPLKINTVRRMPAGAEKPIEQVMSVGWVPFTCEGEWNDKWGGKGFAQDTKRAFAQMCGRTPLVRIQIDEESFVGLITNFTPTYTTRDRHGYHFTLSPHENETIGSFQQSANQVPPQPINQRVDTAVEFLDELVQASDFASNELPVQNFEIEDAKLQLADVQTSVAATVSAALGDSTNDPTRALLQLAGSFRQVRATALEMMFAVQDKRSDVTVAFDDAISILRFDEWRCTTLRSSVMTAGTSRDAEIDLRAKAAQKTKAIHHAREGESLERISLKYYGTADNWQAIFYANNLDSILLEGGELLIIPERTS